MLAGFLKKHPTIVYILFIVFLPPFKVKKLANGQNENNNNVQNNQQRPPNTGSRNFKSKNQGSASNSTSYKQKGMNKGGQMVPNLQHEQKLQGQLMRARELLQETQIKLKEEKSLKKAVQGFKKNPAISRAADEMVSTVPDFECDGCSPYLKSLLVPERGAVSIPDDVMRLHSLRSETVTYNLPITLSPTFDEPTPPTVLSGLLILYPNHPTSLIGYNFLQNGQGDDVVNYFYTQTLITAQQLNQSYDYGRRVSQVLTVQSSTLPSGQYAINGTMNAVRVDGTVSEMDLDPTNLYSTILAATTNISDKIGNVSVGKGVTVLSIPDSFTVPFTRLNDTSPAVQNTGPAITITQNEITDVSQDLAYRLAFNSGPIVVATTAPAGSISFNFDSTQGADFRINCTGNTNVTPQLQTTHVGLTCNISLFDPFGMIIDGNTTLLSSNVGGDNVTFTWSFSEFFSGAPSSPNVTVASGGPIAGVTIAFSLTSQLLIPGTITLNTFDVQIEAIAPLGARPGINTPVVYVPYESVLTNSVMTVTGISNFELIPNPELRKNLPTFYGDYRPGEMEIVKKIVSNRLKYDIRSVWQTDQYRAMIPSFEMLCDIRMHHAISESLGWGDIKNFIKRKVFPFVAGGIKAVVPGSSGVVDTISGLVSDSASGRVIARAADTPIFVNPRRNVVVAQRKPFWTSNAIVKPLLKGVAFPTVTVDENNVEVGELVYLAALGNHSSLLNSSAPRSLTMDGHTVYGLRREGGVQFNTGSDITILPLTPESFRTKYIKILKVAPLVEGHSCDGALWLCHHAKYNGLYPLAVTGEVTFKNGRPELLTNPAVQMKMHYLHKFGVPLAANYKNADLRVEQLSDLLLPPVSIPIVKMNAPIRALAADVDLCGLLDSTGLFQPPIFDGSIEPVRFSTISELIENVFCSALLKQSYVDYWDKVFSIHNETVFKENFCSKASDQDLLPGYFMDIFNRSATKYVDGVVSEILSAFRADPMLCLLGLTVPFVDLGPRQSERTMLLWEHLFVNFCEHFFHCEPMFAAYPVESVKAVGPSLFVVEVTVPDPVPKYTSVHPGVFKRRFTAVVDVCFDEIPLIIGYLCKYLMIEPNELREKKEFITIARLFRQRCEEFGLNPDAKDYEHDKFSKLFSGRGQRYTPFE